MALTDTDIGDILLKESYVSEQELKGALKQCKDRKVSLLTVFTEQGLLTQALYENALAEHFKLPFFDIQEDPPKPELISKLPEEVSRSYSAIVVKQDGNSITVATSDPGEETLEEAIRTNFEQTEPILLGKKSDKKEDKKDKKSKKETKKKEEKKGGLFSKKKDKTKKIKGRK